MKAQSQANQMEEEKTITVAKNWRVIYQISAAAALIAGILMLSGMIGLIISVLKPEAANGWAWFYQDNWLIVIFKILAGFGGNQTGLLHKLNVLDIAILALIGTMFLGLYAALRRTSRTWSLIALALPFLGIVLFIATKIAGRSAVMGAGLVISFIMLRNEIFNRATAFLGILASVLLLVGDFSAGVIHSNIITTLFGIGYGALIAWIFLIARRLLQLGQNKKG